MTVRIDGTNTVSNPAMTGSDADTGICFGDSVIEFSTSGTKRAAVMNSGDFNIEDGNLVVANGHGIDFSAHPNAAGMTSELLDDYEEGTFTPTLGDAWTGINYDLQVARYTKIGNLVHVVITLKFDSTGHSTSTRPQIQSLPFTSSSQTSNYGGTLSFGFGTLELDNQTGITWYVPPGFAHATMYATAGSNFNSFPNANANNDWIQIAGCYTAS